MRTTTPGNGAIVAYQTAVKTQFAKLKHINQFDELVSCSIRLKDNRGYLLCVSELYADDDDVITMLAKWRREATAFRDQFKATFDSTKSWLRKFLLDVPDRILFFVLDRHGKAIGHLGFAHALNDQGLMEVDNVIRGVKSVEPGLMAAAMQSLIDWAVQAISPSGFYLRTLDENTHAIDFYIRLGFMVDQKQPMRRIKEGDEIKYVPQDERDDNPPDEIVVYMKYSLMEATSKDGVKIS
jgi:perosamine synthetase